MKSVFVHKSEKSHHSVAHKAGKFFEIILMALRLNFAIKFSQLSAFINPCCCRDTHVSLLLLQCYPFLSYGCFFLKEKKQHQDDDHDLCRPDVLFVPWLQSQILNHLYTYNLEEYMLSRITKTVALSISNSDSCQRWFLNRLISLCEKHFRIVLCEWETFD